MLSEFFSASASCHLCKFILHLVVKSFLFAYIGMYSTFWLQERNDYKILPRARESNVISHNKIEVVLKSKTKLLDYVQEFNTALRKGA